MRKRPAAPDNTAPKTVRVLRTNREYTQEDLARLLAARTGENWSRDKVANLETGRRTLDVVTLRALAEIFGVPTDVIVYGLDDALGSARPSRRGTPGYDESAGQSRSAGSPSSAHPDPFLRAIRPDPFASDKPNRWRTIPVL